MKVVTIGLDLAKRWAPMRSARNIQVPGGSTQRANVDGRAGGVVNITLQVGALTETVVITIAATTSRQIQFALKLIF